MKFKSIIATGLISSLMFTCPISVVNAADVTQSNNISYNTNNSSIKYSDFAKQIEGMTDEELNQFISDGIDSYTKNSSKCNKSTASEGPIESLWFAAAQILKNNGYECAGKLMDNSVIREDYNENCILYGPVGLFSSKIVNTSSFNSYFNKFKKSKTLPKGLEFKSSDDNDLYLSLHNVSISSSIITPFPAYTEYEFNIYDKYDFAISNYENVLVGLVNNAAWLCQHADVLQPIDVNISFKIYNIK